MHCNLAKTLFEGVIEQNRDIGGVFGYLPVFWPKFDC